LFSYFDYSNQENPSKEKAGEASITLHHLLVYQLC